MLGLKLREEFLGSQTPGTMIQLRDGSGTGMQYGPGEGEGFGPGEGQGFGPGNGQGMGQGMGLRDGSCIDD